MNKALILFFFYIDTSLLLHLHFSSKTIYQYEDLFYFYDFCVCFYLHQLRKEIHGYCCAFVEEH